ncbi:hypothetical protein D3C81_1188460 [compost metagenome]
MAARLQGNIHSTADSKFSCHIESMNFGMRGSLLKMHADPHDGSVIHNNSAYDWIRTRLTQCLLCHIQRH